MATLEHFLGSDWTDELAADWIAAYEVVAAVMVTAAEADAQAPPWYEAGDYRVRAPNRQRRGAPAHSRHADSLSARPSVPSKLLPDLACGATTRPPPCPTRRDRSSSTSERWAADR